MARRSLVFRADSKLFDSELYNYFMSSFETRWHWPRRILAGLILLVGCASTYNLTRAGLAISWCNMYMPQDFAEMSFEHVLRFFLDLRTGVPPAMGILEVIVFKVTGSLFLVTVLLYRLSLVGGFVLSILLFKKRGARLVISAALALLFLKATVLIHPANPAIYDITVPFQILAYFWLLDWLLAHRETPWAVPAMLLLGLLLAFVELSRPFVLLVVPFLITQVLFHFRSHRKLLLAYLAPLVVLSGGWHLKLMMRSQGQIIWSNQGGFNLQRAWTYVPRPRLAPEPFAPRKPGRWSDVNTEVHYRNSNLQSAAIARHVVEHPGMALTNVVRRVASLLRPETMLFRNRPSGPFVGWPYRLAVWGSAAWLGLALIWLLISTVLRRSPSALFSPEGSFAVISAALLFFLAVGEQGEEARFLLSCLPLLAALPLSEKNQPAASLGAIGTPSASTTDRLDCSSTARMSQPISPPNPRASRSITTGNAP
jgi:hypothetical protein